MDPIRPPVDWELDDEWIWPAWKFDLQYEDMFRILHQQHNTVEIPLQDFRSFRHDVQELAKIASSRQELDDLLSERKNCRTAELLGAFNHVTLEVTASPPLLPAGMWAPAVKLFRTRSLASLVLFFGGLVSKTPNMDLSHRQEPRQAPTDTAQEKETPNVCDHTTTSRELPTHESRSNEQNLIFNRASKRRRVARDDEISTNISRQRSKRARRAKTPPTPRYNLRSRHAR